MSFWAATVITNFATAVPYIGESLVQILWGGFSVDNATLNRFFSLHYLLPFVLAALVAAHFIALHEHGSNNPLGISSATDKIPFHPYYTYKDIVGVLVLLLIFFIFVFYSPNLLGHRMAVLVGNSQIYYSTICWNTLLMIDCTQSISEYLSNLYINIYKLFEKLYILKNINTFNITSFLKLTPSFVKIYDQNRSAGNQTNMEEPQLNINHKSDIFEVGSSETICVNSYDYDNEQFGHWLAGLIDGDGSLLISKNGLISIEITLHEEDVKTLYKIKSIVGYGVVKKRSNAKAYRIRFHNKAGVEKVIKWINGKLLTDNKKSKLIKICNMINIDPITNNTFSTNNAWFSGFFDAEGYISIRNKYTLTLSVSQKKRDLLDTISNSFNYGNIYYDKSWDGYNYSITKRDSVKIIMAYFEKFPLLTVKNIDRVTFNRLILFLDRKYHHLNSPYKNRIDNLIRLFRNRKKK